MNSLVRSTALWGYDALVRDLGGDPVPFRAQHGIEPGIEDREEAFVEGTALSRLFESTAAALDCPDFGLRLAEWQGLSILGPVAVIARNAESVGAGLEAIARYLHAHSPVLHLSSGQPDAAGEIAFRFEITALPLEEKRQSYELSMANLVRITRLLGGGDAAPVTISFVHEQMGSSDAYTKALGCDVSFAADCCGFVMTPDALARTCDSADPETRRIAMAYLEANYSHLGPALTDRVAELVRRLLPTGHFSADVVADQMRLHPRTLQRQLAEENASYAEVLDQQRRDLAVRYLAEPKLQIGQIAALLGYTEQSALNRAFRRWFGTTPRRYRVTELAIRRSRG